MLLLLLLLRFLRLLAEFNSCLNAASDNLLKGLDGLLVPSVVLGGLD